MPYCETMKRPCTCGQLHVYDRNGRFPDSINCVGCMTEGEIRSAVAVLLHEWERRFGDAKPDTARLQARA